MFPSVGPSPSPTSGAGTYPVTNGEPTPVSRSSALSYGTPVLPAQVAGLIALAIALLLMMTRKSLRRQRGEKGKPTTATPTSSEGNATS